MPDFSAGPSDRLGDEGVIAFITNRSFIDSRTFDGFRKVVANEFSEIYVVDLGGDVRSNPKISGTKNNVFGIQTGVAISFLVKRAKRRGLQARIHYVRRPEFDTADEKLAFLATSRAAALPYERVEPDARNNWINQSENDWDKLAPIASRETKSATWPSQERAIFKLFSFGLVTNRDEWLYGRDTATVAEKAAHIIAEYNRQRLSQHSPTVQRRPGDEIKWTRSARRALLANVPFEMTSGREVEVMYRPFDKQLLHYYPPLIEMLNQTRAMFGPDGTSRVPTITLTDPTSQKPFMAMAVDRLVDMHFVGAAAGSASFPRARLATSGERVDNITEWGLKQFQRAYGVNGRLDPSRLVTGVEEGGGSDDDPILAATATERASGRNGQVKRQLSKNDIFHYVYAVLHDPVYRAKYALNLKREFPRIPFYPDFWKWTEWGERLMALHINYEAVDPWPLARSDVVDERMKAAAVAPKAILKADKVHGTVRLDTETQLTGFPSEVWDYRLGNRSGIEWVLDQYKEKTPKDPTIRQKFNTYRFGEYKEKVVDLIRRVTTVSVKTVAITQAMESAKR